MELATTQLEQGLGILTGDSEILTIAREVSEIIRASGLDAAVIGGVAVVLHGHVRTTLDVDVFVAQPQPLADELKNHGFEFIPSRKEFVKHGVPVHLVTSNQVEEPPTRVEDIHGIRTIALDELLSMKLRSGTKNILRAQDLADVIGLIRHHRLTGEFAARIPAPLRPEFRKLARAVAADRGQ